MGRALFFCAVFLAGCSGDEAAPSSAQRIDRATWVPTSGQPSVPREFAASLVLPDGRVLISGGLDSAGQPLASSELYSPATEQWAAGPALSVARGKSAAVADVILGGSSTPSVPRAEVDRVSGDAGLSPIAPLLQARSSAAAVLLPGGAILVVGGSGAGSPHNSTELSLPDGGWGSGGVLAISRTQATATALLDGRVLVTGGIGGLGTLASTELRALDGGFFLGPAMVVPRVRHTATLLASGDVLLVGGDGDAGSSAELFVAATSTLRALGAPQQPRAGHTATRLADGRVLVAGGLGATAAEVFEPDAGRFDVAGCLVRPRESHVAALAGSGVVLAFGRGDGGLLAHSERFAPVGGAAQGSACTADCQCASAHCASGICCDRACQGACEACAPVTGACTTVSAHKVCRPVAGPCDVEEVCDGVQPQCPADALRAADVVCRDSSGACDVAERCTGASPACPADVRRPAGTVCREAVAGCDVPERCDGTSGACPPDRLAPVTTVCRPADGGCDVVEFCSGLSAFCPEDRAAPVGTVCRAAADVCDVEEVCQGGPKCPVDRFQPQSVACGDYTCTGDSPQCRTTCSLEGDCASGLACDAGTCAPIAPAKQRYVGFGCAQVGGEGWGAAALAVLALTAARRRRAVPGLAVAALLAASSARAAEPPDAGFFHTGTRGHRGFALRVDALVLKDLLALPVGGEAGLSLGIAERFDLGAWVSIGRYPGARLGVTLHSLDEGERFRPFLQLRGLVHPVPSGVAFGVGLFGGATAALGPGRVVLGVLLEGYAGPPDYVPAGLYLLLGYQWDVYRAPEPWERRMAMPDLGPEPSPVAGLPPAPSPVPRPAAAVATPAPELPLAAPPPLAAPEKPEDRTRVVTRIQIREQLFFGDRQAKLDPSLKARARRVAAALKLLTPVKRLEVAGHADDGADAARCLALSQKRAEAVLEALVAEGVARERLVARGYGRAQPLVSLNSPARKREKNRRVEFNVLEMASP